jgi:hypothetical protein
MKPVQGTVPVQISPAQHWQMHRELARAENGFKQLLSRIHMQSLLILDPEDSSEGRGQKMQA